MHHLWHSLECIFHLDDDPGNCHISARQAVVTSGCKAIPTRHSRTADGGDGGLIGFMPIFKYL